MTGMLPSDRRLVRPRVSAGPRRGREWVTPAAKEVVMYIGIGTALLILLILILVF
jgi:hypothetical protein